MKEKIDSKYYYPDAMVVCTEVKGGDTFTTSPRIIVEVLSKSTRKMDHTVKREAYLQIPSLEEYILIEQDFVHVEVARRSDGWKSTHYFLGDDVPFTAIDLTLSVEEIYERVDNEDMTAWFIEETEAEMLEKEV
jgi:Uma2 family endonuclease